MKRIDKDTLAAAGFGDTLPEDYTYKNVVLRDGRKAVVWLHKQTGHGILDSQYWENQSFYTEDYRSEFGAEIGKKTEASKHLKIYKDLNKKQFDTFSRLLTDKTRFLEIGCSFGGVFNLVAGSGVALCHGVEPNRQDAAFTQQNNKEAKIYNTTFENADLSSDFYDIVVILEVLEHTVSPRGFLQKCFSVLRSGGVIHVEVPNHDDVLLEVYKDTGYHKFYYHKAHIHYFTEKSLRLLCCECGFDGRVSSFLMYPFFNHVWWRQNHEPQPSAVLALSTPIPTNGKTSAEKAINNFYKRVEREYEDLINSNMLGDCLIFQGRKK